MVFEFGKLEYCRNKIFCILFIKGNRAWYTRVLCCKILEFTKLEYHIIFFNRTNPTQQYHSGRTDEELEFLKLEFWKKWQFAIYFRNSVFLLNISKKGGIWPFWPFFGTIYGSHCTFWYHSQVLLYYSANFYFYLQYFL